MDLLLPLRPTANDPDNIAIAIAKAEKAYADAVAYADYLERQMRAVLTTADDTELDRREREATKAHRDAERIDALLEEMRAKIPPTFVTFPARRFA
jgi:hypothetical protein